MSIVKLTVSCSLPVSPNRFSAVRDRDGGISSVLYPPGESPTVLAFKKTLAKLFSVDTDSSVESETEEGVVLTNEWAETEGNGAAIKQVRKKTTIDSISGAVTNVDIHEQVSSETQNKESGIYKILPSQVRLNIMSV